MTEDKHNNSEKASRKRPPKSRHIDVRFTEDEFNIVLMYARMSGRSKSIYLHDVALGYKPSLPMSAEQQEALKGLIGARAELIGIRNALHALPQEERKKLFKRADFMARWMQGINSLIEEWSHIRDNFINMGRNKKDAAQDVLTLYNQMQEDETIERGKEDIRTTLDEIASAK